MRRILCAVARLLLVFGCTSSSVSFSQEFPRSLNYWALSFQIASSPEFRTALQISPAQKAAVDLMRSDRKFEKVFSTKVDPAEIERNEKSLQSIENDLPRKFSDRERSEILSVLNYSDTSNISEYFARGNDEAETALGMILSAEQMKMLRPTALRAKFSTGLRPFEDAEILSLCNAPKSWLSEQVALIESTKSEYAERVKDLRLESLKRVVAALPEEAQQRFVNYAGNSSAPHLRLADDLASRPFEHINPVGPITDITLSDELVKQITDLGEGYFRSMRANLQAGLTREKWVDERRGQMDLAIRKLLTEQQILAVLRAQAFERVMFDVYKPFVQSEFVAYLQLDEATSRRIIALSQTEQTHRLTQIRQLDSNMFERVSATLPEQSRDRIRELFRDVWEIPVEPMLWTTIHSR